MEGNNIWFLAYIIRNFNFKRAIEVRTIFFKTIEVIFSFL